MNDQSWLLRQFEEHRSHLRQVAYRMLGSHSEAADALQETWIKLSRANTGEVLNFGGWLTTVVARVCLDILRARKARREDLVGLEVPEPESGKGAAIDPEEETVLADTIGSALLIVMDSLAPAERVAYVLHDMFDVPFDEVATVIGRSAVASRQLASRARRRVRLAPREGTAQRERQQEIVAAFLAASREGNFESLLALLSPGVELRTDSHAVRLGADEGLMGAEAVADRFVHHAKALRIARVNGAAALVASRGSEPAILFLFSIENRRIVRIDMIADPAQLEASEIVILAT